MLATSNAPARTALAARLAGDLVRTGSPDVTVILPTPIHAENNVTNLDFQTLVSAPKQRERANAATLI
jgi:hypothetical protein